MLTGLNRLLLRTWRRTLLFARGLSRLRRSGSLRFPSCQETSGFGDSRVGFGPIFARRSKPFVTVGIVSDADLQEGLSRLRLSGSLRIRSGSDQSRFWVKVYAVCHFRVLGPVRGLKF